MPNHLHHSTSPYLQQHADNPVQWYPWGEVALQRAKHEAKPILLSIGYSACHWCHVMAHESFEDATTAALMNEHFINIKVDREERPDLDKIYQLAQQVMTQHAGGWPLTMFLSHDTHTPFFGGTYFPPTARHGLPGFADLLQRAARYYREHQQEIQQQHNGLRQLFDELQPEPQRSAPLDATPLHQARADLEQRFDSEFGGFGDAPKFPQPRKLEFLLRHWHASSGTEQPDLHALYMCALTLTRMAEGGIYDQLAGGFFRYATDRYWMIPHFEKMLYDSAELLRIYAQASVATGDALFRRVTRQTADWLLNTLRAPAGSFWSALDADSQGHEGHYYVWHATEVAALLTTAEYAVLAPRFGLDQAANFATQWHLHGHASIDSIAAKLNITPHEAEHTLAHGMQKLLTARQQRIAPALDHKILTGWNALAISGLANAARALQDVMLIDAGAAALTQLQQGAWRNGRLYAVQAEHQALFPAYLDDHAYLLDACLEMLQTRWRSADLSFAIALAEQLLTRFADRERGGFYFTADDHEALLFRSKSFADEATPAGNAIAAQRLLQLGYLLGDARYLSAAEACLRADWLALSEHPTAHASLLVALQDWLQPPQLIVIRGEVAAMNDWQTELNKLYQPRRLMFAIPNDAVLPDAIADKRGTQQTIAYLCQGMTCSQPITSLAALIALVR